MLAVPDVKTRTRPMPADFVERTELLAELDAGGGAGVTLVCAPPGYGKTLLLRDWATRPSPGETAWVTIDGDDNDPRRLWASVAAALAPHISLPTSNSIKSPRAWSTTEHTSLAAELVNNLYAMPNPIRLILDDVDELTDPAPLQGLRFLVQHLPRQVQLVLSSTFDPPVGLSRLRLSSRLHELRADRLRFTLAESASLVVRAGLSLTSSQVQQLHQRTDGWAAGMRLAVLAIADEPDPTRFIAEFSGDERHVADYLTAEVLNRLNPEALAFLRTISIADPISADLAAELSGRDDAGALLDSLEHETSLLTSVGWRRESYRLQPLLRTYLRADLRRHGLRQLHELHAAAARWWAAGHETVRALEHARRSDSTELLSELVRRHAIELIVKGDWVPLRRVLDDLGGDAIASDPQLALVSAITNLDVGDVSAAHRDLRHARDVWPTHSTAELLVLRRLVEQLVSVALGQTPEPANALAAAAEEVPDAPELEALMRLSLGVAHLRESGDLDAARTEFATMLSLAHRYRLDYLAMQSHTCLGLAALGVGDLVAVREAGLAAAATAADHGWQASVWSAAAGVMLSFTELQRAEPAEAARLAAAARESKIAETAPALWFALEVVHGAATCDSGDKMGGLSAIQHARSDLGDNHAAPLLLAAAALLESRAALQLGHLAAARTVRSWLADRTGDCAELELMRAWTAEAEGHEPQARALLRPILESAQAALLPHTPVEAWLLEAELCLSARDRGVARHALSTALGLAKPIDTVRPFAMAGPGVRDLLAAHQGSFGASDTFAARALCAATATATNTAKALSERELTVLTMLPSMLSLTDIATDLTVSVNTVKSHVRSIYTKLGVGSRRAAVLAAHENGLLTISS